MLDFDPRWHEPERPDVSRGSRGGGPDPREREPVEPRDVFREHVHLPRGLERERVDVRDRSYELRGSEARNLAIVGSFRVTGRRPARPVRQAARPTSRRALASARVRPGADRSHRRQGHRGRRADQGGESAARRPACRRWRDRQAFHDGLCKPRELTHESQVYRAYERAAERIRSAEGTSARRAGLPVKRDTSASGNEAKRDRDDDGRGERENERFGGALEHELPYEDGHVQFPDARIEYELPDARTRYEDVEVLTPHYRGAHAAASPAPASRATAAGERESSAFVPARVGGGGRRGGRGTNPTPGRGDAAMTSDERVQAVAKFGVTERQARFLVTVMRHSGSACCDSTAPSPASSTGRRRASSSTSWCGSSTSTTYECAHNRARIYHVQHKSLYRANGEPESHLRRPPALGRAVERLMLLDAVVSSPELVWLTTAEEKRTHLTALTTIDPERLPHVSLGEGAGRRTRWFPDRMPIGIHPEGRAVLVYLVTQPLVDDFRGFLQRHAALLCALRVWTVRIVVPPHLPSMAERAEKAAREELTSPLRPATIDELRWYFEQCRVLPADAAHGLEPRFYRDRSAFQSGRYQLLYQAWKQEGETVLADASSERAPTRSPPARVESKRRCWGHGYAHLSRLIRVA